MRIILVRHGQSVANKKSVIQHPDTPLSKEGLLQAKRIARALSKEKIDIIYSSPFPRARRTAEEIAKFHKKTPFILSEKLGEKRWGKLEGVPWKSLPVSAHRHYADGTVDEMDRSHGGESWRDVERRARSFFRDILRKDGGTILIVSHAEFLRIFLCVLLRVPIIINRAFWLGNAAISEIVWDGRRAKLVAHNSGSVTHFGEGVHK